ncbi:MAG: hypothetical protein ABIN55_11630, partial [Aeromicrobium sp.]
TSTVSDTLRSTSLAPVLEPVLSLVAPNVTAPDVVVPAVVVPEQNLSELIGSLDLLGQGSFPSGESFATNADMFALWSSLADESGDDAVEAVAQASHMPSTSTLPDGGSPLTATWLLLWAGVAAAGAVIVRRSRTAN